MQCKICNGKTKFAKELTLMGKHRAIYNRCENCNFMFAENPHWLKEAYEDPINTTDTGYVLRNVYLSKITLILFTFLFGTKKTYLDYAGGYGMLARLMRDYGLNFLTYDPFTKNLFAKGFEYKNQEISAVTCFECFEHLENPITELEKILKISNNIFFSTRLLPKEIPDSSWEYYGIEHGQHISFYSTKTLRYIAEKYKLNYYTNNDNLHLLTKKKINKYLFKVILKLNKIQLDLFIRKTLSSKTSSDSEFLKK